MLVSEEEVNQTFACWKEDLVGVTGLCGPVVDELLLANVRDHGWDTEQYLIEVLVAGFEESERKTSEAYGKVFARARLALPCAVPRGVGDVCLVCRERVLGDAVGPCGYCLHCACLAEGLRVQDLPLEQYRARDELPLMQQWPCGRADDRVTLSADLETLDLLMTAIPPPTLRAAEVRRLRNDFEDFIGTRRSQVHPQRRNRTAPPHELELANCWRNRWRKASQ